MAIGVQHFQVYFERGTSYLVVERRTEKEHRDKV